VLIGERSPGSVSSDVAMLVKNLVHEFNLACSQLGV
jgi:hypothetical protein